jgi:phosphopantothenoylcysteine decarboxylase/phosphopantothenate--cysteine ligase
LILHSVGPGRRALAAPEIVREIAEAGHQVEVVLEPETRRFVGGAAFAGSAALVDVPTETPEAVLFAPASAGTLARIAHGLGERPAEVYAAGAGSVFVAPDLDAATAVHPAVRENLALLRRDGRQVIVGSTEGMAFVGEVVARVLGGLGGPMSGLRVLVTAGGTHEPLDSVRYLGNRSSGKMGLAVAREALRLGAEVTVVAANVDGPEPGVTWIPVETVDELRAEVLGRAGRADALIMAAAVSDFTPAAPAKEKIRRTEGLMSLELKTTADILKAVRERYPDLFVVGFAATHGDPVADAHNKLASKGVNLVVGNDISQAGIGFGTEENEVYVVGRRWEHFVPRAPKSEVARVILESLVADMSEGRQE